jgi:hypothetical protein
MQLINAYDSITRRHHQLLALERQAKGVTTKHKDASHAVRMDDITDS